MDIENLTKPKRNYWRLDRAGLELKQEIFKLSRILEVLWLIAFSILVLICVPYFAAPEFLRRADYSVILIGQYVPYLGPIYTIFLTFFIVFMILMCISWIMHFMYFSWHVQLQVFMLTKFVRDLGLNVAEDFYLTHCGVVLDGHHQRCIWRNLHFIIQRHNELLSYHREVVRDLRVSITSLLLGISGSCVCITATWTAIIEQQVRAGMLMPVFLIFLAILSFSAQAHEDRFFAICDLAFEASWHQWDIKNRKAYLLLVQQTAQVIGYPFFNTRINREFQLQILKTIYSATSLLVNFYYSSMKH